MPKLQAGQVWQFEHRPGEEGSRIKIAKVEVHPKLGTIVHIQVVGLAFKNPAAPRGVSDQISHLPYAEQAVIDSVTKKEKDADVVTGWEESYEIWRSADDAGIWTIPVSEAITGMEVVFNQGR